MPITRGSNTTASEHASSVVNEVIKKEGKKGKKAIVILVLIALAGLLGTGYFYNRYNSLKKNPNVEAQKEMETIVGKLGKLMVLPTDDTPTVATVADKDRLSGQSFFANAQNGDKLVVYTKTKKAILFREKENKIIEVAPIYFENNATSTGANTATVTPGAAEVNPVENE